MSKPLSDFKGRLVRLSADSYAKTSEGCWIIPLNPDNIEIYFESMSDKRFARSYKRTITLNSNKEANILFPYYIRELRRMKYKRELGLKYYTQYFKIRRELDKCVAEVTHWMYNN
jgi:hypothetical protein